MTGTYTKKAERLIKQLVKHKLSNADVRVMDKIGDISLALVSGAAGTFAMFVDHGKPVIDVDFRFSDTFDGSMRDEKETQFLKMGSRLDKLIFKWDGRANIVEWLSSVIEIVVESFKTMRKVAIAARSQNTTIGHTAGSMALSVGSTPFNINEFNGIYGRAYLSDVTRKQG